MCSPCYLAAAAGAVGGVAECVAGASVVLSKDGVRVAEKTTDTFGDFKFDGLDENSGSYRLDIQGKGFAARTVEFALGESTYLGVIELGARA